MCKTMYLILALSLAAMSPVQAGPAKDHYPNMAPVEQYMMASQADEIALARSAAPASISDKAEILVLGAHGYKTAVPGSNGFVCFVGRAWQRDFDGKDFWNPHVRGPECWNAAAASSGLTDQLKRAQWVLAGVSKAEMATRTKAAWASHEFGPPAPGSMVYMLSRDQYIDDPTPDTPSNWYPHVMLFVPTTEAARWGANRAGSPIFSTTSDAEPITTFFVVAPYWSDGTRGPYAPTLGAKPESHHHG